MSVMKSALATMPRLVAAADRAVDGGEGAPTTGSTKSAQQVSGPAVPKRETRQALTHLQRLEAESIHIFREVIATSDNPVLLYSIGKDSAVLLHLALKAFYPAPLPFPLLHVDTTWKFREMIAFRDQTASRLGLELIVHVNQDGVRQG